MKTLQHLRNEQRLEAAARMALKWRRRVSAEEFRKINAATGLTCSFANLRRLQRELEGVWVVYRASTQETQPPARIAKRLIQVAKDADRLANSLTRPIQTKPFNSTDYMNMLLWGKTLAGLEPTKILNVTDTIKSLPDEDGNTVDIYAFSESDFINILGSLSRSAAALAESFHANVEGRKRAGAKPNPGKEWLNSTFPLIVHAFERAFDREASASVNSRTKELTGAPFGRFAFSVYRAFGAPVTPNTIATAFNKWKADSRDC